MRRMFADIEAEVYVLVDGDGTYDAASGRHGRVASRDSLDMVNGARVARPPTRYRLGHPFGNKLLTGTVAVNFRQSDSRHAVGLSRVVTAVRQVFPRALRRASKPETELTVHALELRLPIAEVDTPYRDRPLGSHSKLRTFRDGFRILKTIVLLVKEERPLRFFSGVGAALAATSVVLSWPLLNDYLATGLIPGFQPRSSRRGS